jgi:hypothetical protein
VQDRVHSSNNADRSPSDGLFYNVLRSLRP